MEFWTWCIVAALAAYWYKDQIKAAAVAKYQQLPPVVKTQLNKAVTRFFIWAADTAFYVETNARRQLYLAKMWVAKRMDVRVQHPYILAYAEFLPTGEVCTEQLRTYYESGAGPSVKDMLTRLVPPGVTNCTMVLLKKTTMGIKVLKINVNFDNGQVMNVVTGATAKPMFGNMSLISIAAAAERQPEPSMLEATPVKVNPDPEPPIVWQYGDDNSGEE